MYFFVLSKQFSCCNAQHLRKLASNEMLYGIRMTQFSTYKKAIFNIENKTICSYFSMTHLGHGPPHVNRAMLVQVLFQYFFTKLISMRKKAISYILLTTGFTLQRSISHSSFAHIICLKRQKEQRPYQTIATFSSTWLHIAQTYFRDIKFWSHESSCITESSFRKPWF